MHSGTSFRGLLTVVLTGSATKSSIVLGSSKSPSTDCGSRLPGSSQASYSDGGSIAGMR